MECDFFSHGIRVGLFTTEGADTLFERHGKQLFDRFHSVLGKAAVACDNDAIIQKRSGNDKPVCGIFVNLRQGRGAQHDGVVKLIATTKEARGTAPLSFYLRRRGIRRPTRRYCCGNAVGLSSTLKKPLPPAVAGVTSTEPVERPLVALPLIGNVAEGVIL